MADSDASLLFIPDISGFTNFVNTTEISHSQHIIAELLELLIDSNQLELVVSEIEGDAVLFYKYQSVPDAASILRQAEEMFLSFQQHLIRYEKQRICDCGACSSASRLSLKIVAHQGTIGLIKVKEFRKPYGADVILVHRLMKNDIDTSEYLLMTPGLLKEMEEQTLAREFPWAEFHQSSSHYEDVGKVGYTYVPLQPLQEQVKLTHDEPRFERMPDPIVNEIYVDLPLDEVFEYISNLEVRSQWNVGVKDVVFKESRVNRVGTAHTCVLPVGTLHFETIAAHLLPAKKVFAERVNNAWFASEMILYFELSAEGQGTHVQFEAHIKFRPLAAWLVKGLIRSSLSKGNKKSLEALKALAENRGMAVIGPMI